jgi:hypothetical protein
MPRGYRCILVALVGWLSLAANQHPAQQQRQAAKTEQVQPPPTYAPYEPLSKDPCYRSKSHDAADLCAQWRAAFAAERAAKATRDAVTWTIVSTALSALALGGLFLSLRQTQSALKDARDNAHTELRAYLYPGIFKIEQLAGSNWRCIVQLHNGGSTPAIDVERHFTAKMKAVPVEARYLWDTKFQGIQYASLGPHTDRQINANITLTPDAQAKIVKREACVIAQLKVRYKTYAGEQITEPTIIAIVMGDDFNKGVMKLISPQQLAYMQEREKKQREAKAKPA